MRILAQPSFITREVNPYPWLLYTHIAALGVDVDEFSPYRLLGNKYAIWHRHWPEWHLSDTNPMKALAKAQSLLLLMDYARSRGVKTVWTVHNFSTHEQLYPNMEAWFWKAFMRRLDGYISLSKTGMGVAQERFPKLRNLPGFVIPHGHYRLEYPNHISPHEARTSLGIPPNAKVLLFFGMIRSYKNVSELIRTFRQVSNSEAILYIAGRPDSPRLAEEIKNEAALDLRVKLQLDFIPTDQVQFYLRAADLVILPYREILNSGSALLALSFDQPILVPLRGALGELQAQVGEQWVRTYTGEIEASQIEEALDWALNTTRSKQAPLEALDWKELAQQTVDAYKVIAAD